MSYAVSVAVGVKSSVRSALVLLPSDNVIVYDFVTLSTLTGFTPGAPVSAYAMAIGSHSSGVIAGSPAGGVKSQASEFIGSTDHVPPEASRDGLRSVTATLMIVRSGY